MYKKNWVGESKIKVCNCIGADKCKDKSCRIVQDYLRIKEKGEG